jgi:hypothetical protein
MPYCKYIGNTFYLDFTGQKSDLISDCPKIAIKTLGQALTIMVDRVRETHLLFCWPNLLKAKQKISL